MAAVDLVFGAAESPLPAYAVDLVFNAPDPTEVPPVLASSAIVFVLTGSAAAVVMAPAPQAALSAPWQRAGRHGGTRAFGGWQPAGRHGGDSAAAAWGRAESRADGARAAWQRAGSRNAAGVSRWQRAGHASSGPQRAAWGRAGGLAEHLAAAWAAATHRRSRGACAWGRADGLRGRVLSPWQSAALLPLPRVIPWGRAGVVPSPVFGHPAGPTDPLGGVPQPRPGVAHLHFCVPAAYDSTDLVFGFEHCVRLPRVPTAIPSKRAYVLTHSIQALRLPDLVPVPLTAFTIDADSGSFCWSFSGVGPEAALTLLDPTEGPVALRIVLDGMTWEFVVESVRRTREFGQTSVTVSGRSASALLGDPYMPEESHLNAVMANAQTVLDDILTSTGCTLDWQIDDWTIPVGAWSFAGTPIAAVNRIAEAAGALVQSPRVGDAVVVRPRYDAMPWEWAAADPDVTVSLDAVVSEGFERADRPPYEGVYLSGQSQGILSLVKRAGTSPALVMPLVTDALMTDVTVAEQRGRSLLGQAGPQAKMTVTLPVLTGPGEPGVVDCGSLIEVGTWRGVVRGVNLRVEGPVVRQTLTIERHL